MAQIDLAGPFHGTRHNACGSESGLVSKACKDTPLKVGLQVEQPVFAVLEYHLHLVIFHGAHSMDAGIHGR